MLNKLKINNLTGGGIKNTLYTHPLRVIYPLAILNSLLIILVYGPLMHDDSYGYIDAINVFFNGGIDQFRTPIYPAFLGICRLVCGKSYFLYLAIFLQHCLLWWSLWFMSDLLKTFRTPLAMQWVLLVTYSTIPAITTISSSVLTEGVVIPLSVILLWICYKIITECRIKYVVAFFVVLFLLIFTRPAFVYFLPIFILLWALLAFMRNNARRAALLSLSMTVLVAAMMLSYMGLFKQRHSTFAMSSVSTINMYYGLRMRGLIDTTAIENENMRADIMASIHEKGYSCDPKVPFWNETTGLIKKYGIPEVNKVVSNSLKTNRVGYVKTIIGRFYASNTELLFTTPLSVPPLSTINDMTVPLGCGSLYIFLLIYSCAFIWLSLKNRQIPWFSLLLLLISWGNVFTVMVGAYSQYARLLLPNMPICLMMIGQLASLLRLRGQDELNFD